MLFEKNSDKTNAVKRSQSRGLMLIGVVLVMIWGTPGGFGGTACAQSIIAPAAQGFTHDTTDSDQPFSEVTWQLVSGADVDGYVTQLSCGPFVHATAGSFKADSKLVIRILSSSGSANWTVTAANDQTDYGTGDETAVVSAQSSAVGDGEVGLTVTFLDSDFSRLAAGVYNMTVTGTITAN